MSTCVKARTCLRVYMREREGVREKKKERERERVREKSSWGGTS